MLCRWIASHLTLVVALSLSTSSRAQDAEHAQSPPSVPPAASPALETAQRSDAQAATNLEETSDARWDNARPIVSRGEALFSNGNYEGALADFSQAYELLANNPRQAAVLYNLALCYERLFRYDEALRYYERYLRESGPAAEDRATVSAIVSALRGLLATLQIESNVPAEVWIDDRRMSELPATLSVPGGRHVIEVRARLYESARRELQLHARSSYRVRLDLEPLSNYRGLGPGYFFGSVGLTAALLVTSAILTGQAFAARDSGLATAQSTMQLRTAELEQQQQRVNRWSLGADLALGGALLFGATSLVLFLLTDWDARGHERVAVRTRRDATLVLQASLNGLALKASTP